MQTELQAALVKASLQGVRELDEECSEVKAMVAKRDKLAQDMGALRYATLPAWPLAWFMLLAMLCNVGGSRPSSVGPDSREQLV